MKSPFKRKKEGERERLRSFWWFFIAATAGLDSLSVPTTTDPLGSFSDYKLYPHNNTAIARINKSVDEKLRRRSRRRRTVTR